MSAPFFSILLPTKNRSEIVGQAIESALSQTFKDFEVVVSDNDDSSTATADVVSKFTDTRVRYFRTSGKLAMHENWDNAFTQSSGRHVIVLEDKMRLVPNALEILHGFLSKRPDAVISYGLGNLPQPGIPPAVVRCSEPVLFRTDQAVRLFCDFADKAWVILPKGLNSCIKRDFLLEVKQSSVTGFLFSHLCPDYAFSFMALSKLDQFFHLRDNLSYIPRFPTQDKYSNGEASYTKSPLVRRFMRELPVPTDEILKWVPIKSEWLWINPVVYDFLTKFKNPKYPESINWVKYHAHCFSLILISKERGGDVRPEVAEFKRSLREHGLLFSIQVYLEIAIRIGRAVCNRTLNKFRKN